MYCTKCGFKKSIVSSKGYCRYCLLPCDENDGEYHTDCKREMDKFKQPEKKPVRGYRSPNNDRPTGVAYNPERLQELRRRLAEIQEGF